MFRIPGGSSNWNLSVAIDSGFNIDKIPLFIDTHNLEYGISKSSPCYNAGNNFLYYSLLQGFQTSLIESMMELLILVLMNFFLVSILFKVI